MSEFVEIIDTNRHDTGSTTARSVDEVALIRDTVSHCARVLIAQNSSRRRPWAGPNFFAAPEAQAATEPPRAVPERVPVAQTWVVRSQFPSYPMTRLRRTEL